MATVPVDVDAIMQVMNRAFDPRFGEAWTRAQFLGALSLPGTRCITVDGDGQIDPTDRTPVGFALTRSVVDETELLLLAVDPAWRGNGLAGQLLNALVSQSADSGIARIFLEMREDNPVRALYARHGFRPVGRRRAYYLGMDGSTRDALTFAIEITD